MDPFGGWMDIKMCADVSRQQAGEHLGGGRDQQTGRDKSLKLFLTLWVMGSARVHYANDVTTSNNWPGGIIWSLAASPLKPRSGPAVCLVRTAASSPDVSGASEARHHGPRCIYRWLYQLIAGLQHVASKLQRKDSARLWDFLLNLLPEFSGGPSLAHIWPFWIYSCNPWF